MRCDSNRGLKSYPRITRIFANVVLKTMIHEYREYRKMTVFGRLFLLYADSSSHLDLARCGTL
jgi:hypothetical protein